MNAARRPDHVRIGKAERCTVDSGTRKKVAIAITADNREWCECWARYSVEEGKSIAGLRLPRLPRCNAPGSIARRSEPPMVMMFVCGHCGGGVPIKIRGRRRVNTLSAFSGDRLVSNKPTICRVRKPPRNIAIVMQGSSLVTTATLL